MTKPAWLRIASAGLAFLQFVNAGMATMHASPVIALVCGGLLAFSQTLINEFSINTTPSAAK